ncbi:hypothetical protein E4T56_gene11081 [Termitomyces sp. T112]|nr:hypothetical protein E4T56_gene11081 [Termitomyces sp. T112]
MSRPSPNTIGLTLDVSDLVLSTLSNAPKLTQVPFLQTAAGLALSIVQIAQNVRSNKSAFKRLVDDASALVYIIIRNDDKVSAGGANVTPAYLKHTKELLETLEEISEFMKAQASKNKVLRIIQAKSDVGVIQEYRDRLRQSLDVFGLESTISIQDSLGLMQERLVDIHNHVKQKEEPKQQGVLSAPPNKKACHDQMKDAADEIDIDGEERSEAVLDRNQLAAGQDTSMIAVLNKVHDAEVIGADMMAVGGDIRAPSELQTTNTRPNVITVINNSTGLKIHGGVFRAVGGSVYA